MNDPQHINVSSSYAYKIEKGDNTKMITQQYIQLTTRAIEIQQLNPGGHIQKTQHQASIYLSIDKKARKNKACGLTYQSAVKKESKVVNCDWVPGHAVCCNTLML